MIEYDTLEVMHRIKLVLLIIPFLFVSCAAWQKAEPTVESLLETCDTGQQVCVDVAGNQVCAEPVELARLLAEYAEVMSAKKVDPNPAYLEGDTTSSNTSAPEPEPPITPSPEPEPPKPSPEVPAVQ